MSGGARGAVVFLGIAVISVGWNRRACSPVTSWLNDERVASWRLMVREQLTARTLDEAVAMALRPDRASSYNTVFAHRDGRVVNVEGSATDAEITTISAAGTLAHTNHYACERMRRFEGDPAYAVRSSVRLRGAELLDGPRGVTGPGPSGRSSWRTLSRPRDQPLDLPPRRWCGAARLRSGASPTSRRRDRLRPRSALPGRGVATGSPEVSPGPPVARCASRSSR
jgi:hypothetical protein